VVVLEVVTNLVLVGGPNTALGTLFMTLLVVHVKFVGIIKELYAK